MNCDSIREVLHEYLHGWCEPGQAAAIRSHLDACPACSAESRDAQSTLSLLKALPEIEPAPETWRKIEAKINIPSVAIRAGGFKTWLRVAAAASLLVAALSFAVVATMPRTRALPVVEGGRALNWNESFHAQKFARITLPDVGTLELNQNSTVRFPDPRTCVLESGDVFAEINLSGRGFEIQSGQTSARVHGTLFGVTAPATVYVVEGAVEVRPAQGGLLRLGPQQAAVGADLSPRGADEFVQWLGRYRRPTVTLRLDPRDRTTITPGSPLKWDLILETDALVPLHLGQPRDISQFLFLLVNGASVPLDPNGASLKTATRAANGMVRLDVSHSCVIECAIDPALFREKGTAAVRALFTSGTHAPEGAWVGIVKSDPIKVEVR